MRTKVRIWSNDRTVGGGRFGTGPLAYLLKNRVYLGEVVHQDKFFQGDHAPIINRDLFEAVQEKLKNGTIERKLKLKGSPSLLTGKIYDDCGNRMTPSHTVKNGVRYRYYVSQAVLEKRAGTGGSVTRVPAAEIEALVTEAFSSLDRTDDCAKLADEWIQQQLDRVVVNSNAIKLHVAGTKSEAGEKQDAQVLTIPWKPQKSVAVKGVSGGQPNQQSGGTKNRDALVTAIAKARSWVEELVADRITISGIAAREGKGERHIRLLLPLAFTSPILVDAIAAGAAPNCLTIALLSQQISNSWSGREGVS